MPDTITIAKWAALSVVVVCWTYLTVQKYDGEIVTNLGQIITLILGSLGISKLTGK